MNVLVKANTEMANKVLFIIQTREELESDGKGHKTI